MASKRVEIAKQQRQGNVQIQSLSAEETQKSIEELINVGRQNVKNLSHFQRNRANNKLPTSFYQPKTKSRGSSVGHSREGSSDDGFGSGRHTLSPSGAFAAGLSHAMQGGHHSPGGNVGLNCPTPGHIIHQRQASAPALINYGAMEQDPFEKTGQHRQPQRLQTDVSGLMGNKEGSAYGTLPRPAHPLPVSQHARAFSGHTSDPASLPPVAHSYSKSMSAVHHHPHHVGPSTHHSSSMAYAAGGSRAMVDPGLPPIAHQRSVRSCDFEAIGMGSAGSATTSHLIPSPMDQQQQQQYQQQQQLMNQMPRSAEMLIPMQSTTTFGGSGDVAYLAAAAAGEGGSNFWTSSSGSLTGPRAKSQSLDPLTLSSTASSVSHHIPATHHSSMTVYPGHQQRHPEPQPFTMAAHVPQPQQQHPPIQRAPTDSIAIDTSELDAEEEKLLGPLPAGWQKSRDEKGDAYFIDHNTQTTTWYDPRIAREEQEATINARHGELVQSDAYTACIPADEQMRQQQQAASTLTTAGSDYSRMQQQPPGPQQQLRHGISSLHERQQQLAQTDLLDNQSAGTSVSYFTPPHQALYCSDESSMEVDSAYQPSAIPMQSSSCLYAGMLDPSSVVQDLNPHEFDRYLQISSSNPNSGDSSTTQSRQQTHQQPQLNHHYHPATQLNSAQPAPVAGVPQPQVVMAASHPQYGGVMR